MSDYCISISFKTSNEELIIKIISQLESRCMDMDDAEAFDLFYHYADEAQTLVTKKNDRSDKTWVCDGLALEDWLSPLGCDFRT